MSREIRVSADGDSVAIRTDEAQDSYKAWNVTHALDGSFWGFEMHVEGWEVIVEGSSS